jgi:hypothetical protein
MTITVNKMATERIIAMLVLVLRFMTSDDSAKTISTKSGKDLPSNNSIKALKHEVCEVVFKNQVLPH